MSEDNNMNFKIGDKVIIDNDKLENHNKKGTIIDVFDNGKLAVILDVVGGISFYNDNDLKLTETIEKESVVEVANQQGHCFKDNRNLEKEYAEQVKKEEKFEFDPHKPFFDVGDNVIYVGDNFKDFKGMTGRIVKLDKEHWKYKVDFAGKISDYIEEDWLEPADGVKKKFTDDVMEQIKREAEERKAEKKQKEFAEKANCSNGETKEEYRPKIGDVVCYVGDDEHIKKYMKNAESYVGKVTRIASATYVEVMFDAVPYLCGVKNNEIAELKVKYQKMDSVTEFVCDICGIFDKLKETFVKKNKQYATSDPLANFRTGALLKYHAAGYAEMYEEAKDYQRKHIAHIMNNKIDGPKVEESLADNAVYSIIELYMWRKQHDKSNKV